MKVINFKDARRLSSKEIRKKIRLELYNNHTSGLATNKLLILSFYLKNTQLILIIYKLTKSVSSAGSNKLNNPLKLGDDIILDLMCHIMFIKMEH